MRKALAGMFCAAALAGCASFDVQPVPLSEKPILTRDVLVTLREDVDFDKKNLVGWSMRYFDPKLELWRCLVLLRDYPHYLGHEMDHCFRGPWHDGPNGDDFK